MDKKPEKQQSGRVNYMRVIAGGYLIYLAYNLTKGLIEDNGVKPVFAIPAIVVFLVAGVLMLLQQWKAYKYGVDHIDDPNSWNDEEEDVELEAELAEMKAAALEASDEEELLDEETESVEEAPAEDEEENA